MAAAAHNTSSQRVVQKMEQPPADSGKQKERALSSPGRRVRATLSSRERSDTAPTKTAATSSSVEWPLLESPALSRMQVTGFEMLNGSVVSHRVWLAVASDIECMVRMVKIHVNIGRWMYM